MSTPAAPTASNINPHFIGSDGYKLWKEQRRQFYLNLYNGDHRAADRDWALEILDTEYFVPSDTTKTALDRFKDRGPANGRGDVTTLKDLVRRHRASLAMVLMPDVGRYHIEEICNAVEELAETEE